MLSLIFILFVKIYSEGTMWSIIYIYSYFSTLFVCQIRLIPRFSSSWEGGVTLPQISYKPSQDLREATLLWGTISVQQLVRSFSTERHKNRHPVIPPKWKYPPPPRLINTLDALEGENGNITTIIFYTISISNILQKFI